MLIVHKKRFIAHKGNLNQMEDRAGGKMTGNSSESESVHGPVDVWSMLWFVI